MVVGCATPGGVLYVHPEFLSGTITASCGHDVFLKQIPSSNQTWQWKMDHLSVLFLLRPPFIGDFQPAMFDDTRPGKCYSALPKMP